MPQPKAPAWTEEELATLRAIYPDNGVEAVVAALPNRSWRAVYVMAYKHGLRTTHGAEAPKLLLVGQRLEEAIRLREREGWSYDRIGAHFGISAASVSNAVLIALCPRKGYTPAPRDRHGRLTDDGLERLRLLLRKGMKAVDIQMRLGLSAARVAEERRRYSADLKTRGKAPLPAPGNGEAYCGRRIGVAKRREIEQLFMQGLGSKKISERTGVGNTQIGRIRNRLIKRLARKGECLPGCDRDGKRHVQAESSRFIPPTAVARLRELLLDGWPVIRAAREAGVGTKSSYRLRDEFAAELEAKGDRLPATRNWRSGAELKGAAEARWLPKGMLYRYRKLVIELGADAAKTRVLSEIAGAKRAEAARPLTFEEQLERVRNGAGLHIHQPLRRVMADVTLGGVATGIL